MARNYASPASDDPLVATFRHKKHVFGRQGKNPAAVQDAAIRRPSRSISRSRLPPQAAGRMRKLLQYG